MNFEASCSNVKLKSIRDFLKVAEVTFRST